MNKEIFEEIKILLDKNETSKAEYALSKLHAEHHKNPEYLFLRGKIFYINKLYYIAIDTLFLALEFDKNDKIYSLLGKIYKDLGNEELSKKILDKNLRFSEINKIKDTMTGLFRKKDSEC